MLSSPEDKKAYLAMLTKRRKVRSLIADARTVLQNAASALEANQNATNDLSDEAQELISSPIVNLEDFKNYLSMIEDARTQYAAAEDSRAEAQAKVDKLQKQLDDFNAQINFVKCYYKQLGKVIPFEGARSKVAG